MVVGVRWAIGPWVVEDILVGAVFGALLWPRLIP